MSAKSRKKNYYLLQTLHEEIVNFDIISFDIFDTAILRKVLFPQDIFKLLSQWVYQEFNIVDFNYIRQNTEQEVRNMSKFDEITIREIYESIQSKYPSLDVNCIMRKEIELEFENIFNSGSPEILSS